MPFTFKYREFAEALYLALQEDAFYIEMEKSAGDGQAAKEAMLRYMEFSMIEGEKYGEVVRSENNGHGVSIWAKPLSDGREKEKSELKKSFLKSHMGHGSLKTYNEIVSYMSEKSDQLIEKNTWYLSILGILPEFQGNGLGSALITPVLSKTDRLNVTTYLETFTPRNMTFYHRLGYREIASIHEPTTDTDYWIMVREPTKI